MSAERGLYFDALTEVIKGVSHSCVDAAHVKAGIESMGQGNAMLQSEIDHSRQSLHFHEKTLQDLQCKLQDSLTQKRLLEIKNSNLMIEHKELQDRLMYALSCRGKLQGSSSLQHQLVSIMLN